IACTLTDDNTVMNGLLDDVSKALTTASGVVIDARINNEEESDRIDTFLRQVVPAMVDVPIALGATRYRMHNGYATQVRGGSDLYSSAFLMSGQQSLAGRSQKASPILFIINEIGRASCRERV